MFNLEDVRIDPALNNFLWSKGIRNPPRRIRVRMAKVEGEETYVSVTHVPCKDFKGLMTEVTVAEE
jgi:large subunit ribosomal protein L31e